MTDKSLVLVRPHIPKAETRIQNVEEAVLDLADQLEGPPLAGILFFCSPSYDMTKLGALFDETFSCPVLGCTTAGEIGLRYQEKSIVGVGLPASLFRIHIHAALPLTKFEAELNKARGKLSQKIDDEKSFALLLYDGLSKHKHQATALSKRFKALRTIGAAVGGTQEWENGRIYFGGKFFEDTVAFAVFETRLPFRFFSFKHVFDEKSNIAPGEDLLNSLKTQIDTLRAEMPDILFTLGFESYLRRHLINENGLESDVAHLLSPLNLTGFSTQGELNQGALYSETMTGVVFGAG